MKPKLLRSILRIGMTLLGVLLCGLLVYLGLRIFFINKNARETREAFLSRVQIGDSREDALDAFSDAWFHTRCQFSKSSPVVRDLFFYGERDPEWARIINIESKETPDGIFIVKYVAELGNDFLGAFQLFDDEACSPPPSSAFSSQP